MDRFNNLLSVKFVLLSHNTDVIHQTNYKVSGCSHSCSAGFKLKLKETLVKPNSFLSYSKAGCQLFTDIYLLDKQTNIIVLYYFSNYGVAKIGNVLLNVRNFPCLTQSNPET